MKRVIILLVVVILVILIWAPWMTNNWCKQRIIGYKFNSYESVDNTWEIKIVWIPFGRRLWVWSLEQLPPPGTIGGWGYECFMLFSGNVYLVVGR